MLWLICDIALEGTSCPRRWEKDGFICSLAFVFVYSINYHNHKRSRSLSSDLFCLIWYAGRKYPNRLGLIGWNVSWVRAFAPKRFYQPNHKTHSLSVFQREKWGHQMTANTFDYCGIHGQSRTQNTSVTVPFLGHVHVLFALFFHHDDNKKWPSASDSMTGPQRCDSSSLRPSE